MLKNTLINRAVTKKIATALGPLNDQEAIVGNLLHDAQEDRFQWIFSRFSAIAQHP